MYRGATSDYSVDNHTVIRYHKYMSIKRFPHPPMFRVISDKEEIMRFRAKDAETAKEEASRHTLVYRKRFPLAVNTVEQLKEGEWLEVGSI